MRKQVDGDGVTGPGQDLIPAGDNDGSATPSSRVTCGRAPDSGQSWEQTTGIEVDLPALGGLAKSLRPHVRACMGTAVPA